METNKIDHFNSLLSTNEINILKILTFYLGGPARELAASLVLVQEFMLLKGHVLNRSAPCEQNDIHYFFEEINPYLEGDSSSELAQMKDFLQQFESMKDILEVMKAVQSQSDTDDATTDDFIHSFFASL